MCTKIELCRKCKSMQDIIYAERIAEEFMALLISSKKIGINLNITVY